MAWTVLRKACVGCLDADSFSLAELRRLALCVTEGSSRACEAWRA